MDIYQKIWNADQEENGIPAILDAAKGDPAVGYVVVNEIKDESPNHQLFTEVVIPEHKMHTYNLCKKLFNNYNLDKTKPEDVTSEETAEMHEFLEAIVDTKPMLVAREWMEQQTGEEYSSERWYNILKEVWFTHYNRSSGRDLTGFEHVVVGEQKQAIVSGYHFWYKYYLDDTFNLLNSDDILYLGTRGDNQDGNLLVPEVSTLSYKWMAFDYQAEARRPLYKKIGGFFNGCSVEGLMAIGTIRFLPQGRAPKEAVINNAKYNLRLYRSDNNKHLTTYYPVFVKQLLPVGGGGDNGNGSSNNEITAKNNIKMIAALVNPEGHDEGRETVTLINISPADIQMDGWLIEDKNENTFTIPSRLLKAGHSTMIILPKHTAQLSNKGGKIELKCPEGNVVDSVTYAKAQVKEQGWTLVF